VLKDKDGLVAEGIFLSPDPNGDLTSWALKLRGPKDTPYEMGMFELTIDLPDAYP
jgi:ubiquitin-protein ligase